MRLLPPAAISFVLILTLHGTAWSRDDAPDWVHTPTIVADGEFFYVRGSGATMAVARIAAMGQFSQFIRTDIVSAIEVGSSLIMVQGSLEEQLALISDLRAFSSESVEGAFTIAHAATAEGCHVLMAIPRANLPAWTNRVRDLRFPPPPERSVYRSGPTSADLPIGTSAGYSVDDAFTVHGRDETLPIIREYGVGRLTAVGLETSVLSLYDAADLPEPSYLWVTPTGDTGISIGASLGLSGLDYPDLNSLGLDIESRDTAVEMGLNLGWNMTFLNISEFWLTLSPSVALASPVTGIGVEIGISKLFRYRRLTAGVSLAGGFRYLLLDTEGSALSAGGAAVGSVSQVNWGGSVSAIAGYDLTLNLRLQVQAGWRLYQDSTVWESGENAFDLGWRLSASGFIAQISICYRV